MNGMEYTPAILRAKGVAVPVAQVARHQEKIGPPPTDPLAEDDRPVEVRYEQATDEEGNVLEEDKPLWLRFTMNAIADLEERYGSQAQFQQDFMMRPVSAIREVFAIVGGWSEEQAGARMLGAHIETYKSAIGAAWGLAHGMDPSKLARAMQQVARAGAEKIAFVDGLMEPPSTEGSSPGTDGSQPGPEPDGPSTNSGD